MFYEIILNPNSVYTTARCNFNGFAESYVKRLFPGTASSDIKGLSGYFKGYDSPMNKDEWLSVCGDTVHRHDRDRLMCSTLAPIDKRDTLVALLAFNLEIASIPELVSEPLLGEMRLQWWRDVLDSLYAGTVVEHPVALGLAEGIDKHRLTKPLFEEYLDGRSFDLQGKAPASIENLVAYATATAGAVNELMSEVLGVSSLPADQQADVRAAVRHGGVAWGLSGLLYSVAFHAALGRSYLPSDLAEGDRVAAVCEAARRHIGQARDAHHTVPNSMLPVMMPVVLAEYRLRQISRCGFDPHDPRLQNPGIGRLFRFYGRLLAKRY